MCMDCDFLCKCFRTQEIFVKNEDMYFYSVSSWLFSQYMNWCDLYVKTQLVVFNVA